MITTLFIIYGICALIAILKERQLEPKTKFSLYLVYAVLSPLFVLSYIIPHKKNPINMHGKWENGGNSNLDANINDN